MGSTSLGGSGIGFGGTIGTTWRDRECIRRLHARELALNLKMPLVAAEVMCGSVEVWDARERIAQHKGNPELACLGPRPRNEDHMVVMRGDTKGSQVKVLHKEKNVTSMGADVRTREPTQGMDELYKTPYGDCEGSFMECGI